MGQPFNNRYGLPGPPERRREKQTLFSMTQGEEMAADQQSGGRQHRPRTAHSTLTHQQQRASCRCRLVCLLFRACSPSLGEARP